MTALAFLVALVLPPEPDVSAWVGNLGHARYVVREHAMKRLSETNAARQLIAATHSPDAETSRRASVALGAIVEREAAALEPVPEMDSAWRDVTGHYYDASKAPPAMQECLVAAFVTPVSDPNPVPYRAYYAATRAWVRQQLAHGTSAPLLRLVLAEMHRRDADFLARSGHGEDAALVVDADAYRRGK